MADKKPSIICRGKNLHLSTVKQFLYALPKSDMPKSQFVAIAEERMNGFSQTHSQIARQMGLYYCDKDNICHPRFHRALSNVEIIRYAQKWAELYFVPNPYTPSFPSECKPTNIYAYLYAHRSEHKSLDDELDSIFGIELNEHDKAKAYLMQFTDMLELPENKYDFANNDGDGSSISVDIDKNDEKAFYDYFDIANPISGEMSQRVSIKKSTQKIYYGTPGSGKSYKVKQEYDEKYPEDQVIRTTFHPDTDYATFVGGYKPVTEKAKDGNGKITYQFVPQSFTNAYVKAWNDLAHPYFLIIEEINRGNCAQIFGDIFQLLDRNDDGYSEYPIDAYSDLKEYLQKGTDEGGNPVLQNKSGIADGKLCLPPNLNLIATMNTSDQSLFPMDTAFKRRWDWEYVPIEYQNEKSSLFTVSIGGETFNWSKFLEKINARIKKLTSSEDKQMGNFFIKHSVDEKEFINKVMFYLWSEVGKDNYQTSDRLFVCYNGTDKSRKIDFSFNELYEEGSTVKLKDFMHIILDDNSEE